MFDSILNNLYEIRQVSGISPQADDRRCLTEARVPNFNGEKGYIMT